MITKEKNLEFLERLIQDTEEGKIEWETETFGNTFKYNSGDVCFFLGPQMFSITYSDSKIYHLDLYEDDLKIKTSELYKKVHTIEYKDVIPVIDNYLKG